MVQKRGQINSHHFAHNKRQNCDHWYVNKMSSWHRYMQSLFPVEFREIALWNDDKTEFHIADVSFFYRGNRYVFEFQHSPISIKEFYRRSDFYKSHGILIWVFDFCECAAQKQIYYKEKYSEAKIINLVWPGRDRVRFLDGLNISSLGDNVHVLFHISTGLGKERLQGNENNEWYSWTYEDPFHRERYFVEPTSRSWEKLEDFYATYYTEDNFRKIISKYTT